MEINVQEDKVLNKRLYKQSLSGTINRGCKVTFTNVEPGLYLSNVTIIPDSSVGLCQWGPDSNCGINGFVSALPREIGGRSFPTIINVCSTCDVSINISGRTEIGSSTYLCMVVDDKSVVFLKQL